MVPLTQQTLATNAYRTLGISASSNQSAIEGAARRLRIWPNPEMIPPTPWDLPWLGPLPRSRNDIEQAVSRLAQPESRLEERLLWYHVGRPPAGPADGMEPVSPAQPDRHAAALAALHGAWIGDPEVADSARWRQLMGKLADLSASPEFTDWLMQVEVAGDFDKRASRDEAAAVARSLPAALAFALIPKAQAAIDRGNIGRGTELLAVIRSAGSGGDVHEAVRALLDRIEDTLAVKCREMDAELRAKLRTNHQAPEGYYPANRAASTWAMLFYGRWIQGPLKGLCELAADDRDRLTRVRSKCGEELALLALGWEWSGYFARAEATLLEALALAAGSTAEADIRTALDRCRPKAAYERDHPVRRAVGAAARKFIPRRLPWWKKAVRIAIAIWLLPVVVAAIAAFFSPPVSDEQAQPLPSAQVLEHVIANLAPSTIPSNSAVIRPDAGRPPGDSGPSDSVGEVNREH